MEPRNTNDSLSRAGAEDRSYILQSCSLPYAAFWQPEWLVPSTWHEHAPFAFSLVQILRPRTIVELGTHHGFSFLVFCQAVAQTGIQARCYAIDTWKGDEHAGYHGEQVYQKLKQHHDVRYGSFSRLVRSTFDEAVGHFADCSIDLLHIDGRHFYDDVKHDFKTWRSKLSNQNITLLHDTNVRELNFGVWKFWREISNDYPSFEFYHAHGLGLLAVGPDLPKGIRELLEAKSVEKSLMRNVYARLGSGISGLFREQEDRHKLDEGISAAQYIERLTHETAAAREEAARANLTISEGRQQSARLNAQLLAARDELARVSGELFSTSQRDAARLGAAREDTRRLRAELAAAQKKTELLSVELSSIISSTSWRLGAPLRFLALRYRAVRRLSRRLLKGMWWTLTGKIIWRPWVNQQKPTNPNETLSNREHELREIDPNRTAQIESDTADVMFVSARGQVINDQDGMHQQMARLHAAMEDLRLEFEAERFRTAPLTTSALEEHVHRIGRAEANLTRLDAAVGHTMALLQSAETERFHERERLDGALGALEGITDEVVDKFHAARRTPEYKAVYEVSEPLISVCVATVDRAEILIERAIKSLLEQTYRNLQILVVGDNCMDDTGQRLAAIRDSRIEFVNLSERGPYPMPGRDRWCVAGANAVNHALSLCEGYFITHLDDDDRATPDRIQILLRAARETRADFLWHPFWTEAPDGTWSRLGNGRLEVGQVTAGSIFYHGYLKQFLCDVRAYRLGEPGDWNRIRRIKRLRPHLRFVSEPLLYHHREGNQGIFKLRPGEQFLE